jgi:DNA-binding GntR family transcriptional regulator
MAEQTLADAFAVSRSPVRGALRLLAERGFVAHVRNRGYFLATDGVAIDPGDLEGLTSDVEALYRRVVRDLIGGALPEEVTTVDLQRRYGAGRATVDRLLTYMRGEGLIQRREGHGWRFLPALTSEAAYDASYRFRLIIEPAALHEPTFAADPAHLDRLIRAHRRLVDGGLDRASYVLMYDVDAAFHAAIGQWSGNSFLHQCVEQQNRMRRLTEYEFYADRARMHESAREHLAILHAVAQGDTARASDLLHDHIARSWALRPAFQGGGEGATAGAAAG